MNVLRLLDSRERACHRFDCYSDKLNEYGTMVALSNLQSQSEDHYPCEDYMESDDPMYSCPPYACKFSRVPNEEHILAVALEEGSVVIFNTAKSRWHSFVCDFRAHHNVIFDIKWLNDVPSLLTASGDSTAALWDVNTVQKVSSFVGHAGSVKSVDVKPGDQVFATGSRDGTIRIWDMRQNHVVGGDKMHLDNLLKNVHQVNVKSDQSATPKRRSAVTHQNVNVVLFQDDHNLISAGVDGCIKVWDLRKSYIAYKSDPIPKFVFPYLGYSIKNIGYTSLTLNSSKTRLFASCTDSIIYEFSCASYDSQPVAKYYGHQNSSYYVKSTLSPDDKFLLSGSNNNCAYIWKVGQRQPNMPVMHLVGHREEVTSVDWCQSGIPKIVTCSDDTTFRIWRISNLNEDDDDYNYLRCGKCIKMPEMEPSRRDFKVKRSITTSASIAQAFQSPKRTSHTNETSLCEIQNIPSSSKTVYSSPTENLPNFVVDKLTPVRTCNESVRKTRQRKVNWLTKYASTSGRQTAGIDSRYKKRKLIRHRQTKAVKVDKCLEHYFA